MVAGPGGEVVAGHGGVGGGWSVGCSVRKIKSNFFISLDGVVESPDKWHFSYFDEEMGNAVGARFATADAMLLGRVLYDEWAAYWPQHATSRSVTS